MNYLTRVDFQDGTSAVRGWLDGDKRQGLWIEQTREQVTMSIYEAGELRSQQTIRANGPFDIKELLERAAPSQAPSPAPSQKLVTEQKVERKRRERNEERQRPRPRT